MFHKFTYLQIFSSAVVELIFFCDMHVCMYTYKHTYKQNIHTKHFSMPLENFILIKKGEKLL